MSKGNSGLLSKFQLKKEFSSIGVIGSSTGFEVLKEVIVRVRISNAKPSNILLVKGRMVTDTEWEEIGIVEGNNSETFHIASYDYIQFESIVYDSTSTKNYIISSAFFQDGMFAVDAINKLNETLSKSLHMINSNICKLGNDLEILKKQLSLVTDHESEEVE